MWDRVVVIEVEKERGARDDDGDRLRAHGTRHTVDRQLGGCDASKSRTLDRCARV